MGTNLRPDVQAAVDRNCGNFGLKKPALALQNMLLDGETVTAILNCQYRGKIGAAALTNRRFVVLIASLVGSTSEDIPFDNISSVEFQRGFMSTELTVIASGQRITVTHAVVTDAEDFAQAVRAVIGKPSPAAAPAYAQAPVAAPPVQQATPDVAAQLTQLKGLFDAGILTPAEYEEKRASLVAQLG